MSTSKARFQSSSSSKVQGKTSNNGGKFVCQLLEPLMIWYNLWFEVSKRANNATVATGASGGKGGPLQVIFNGRIVTPQTLIPKKGHYHSSSSKDAYLNKKGKPLAKPQTIDETASESADRASTAPANNKLLSKKWVHVASFVFFCVLCYFFCYNEVLCVWFSMSCIYCIYI